MARRPLLNTLWPGLVACALVACSQRHERREPGGEREIELQFDVRLAGERVACGQTLPALGANRREGSLRDLRFFVHDVQLIDRDGVHVALQLSDDGLWQSSGVALLDFEDGSADCENGSPELNAQLFGTAPDGDYVGLAFRIGVPEALNHLDPFQQAAPFGNSGLHWGWTQGYKFLRLDLGLGAADGQAADGYEIHLGSDGCSREGKKIRCERQNVAQVELRSFDAQRDKVVLDLSALLASVDLVRRPDEEAVPGCTSKADDDDCAPVFEAFGLSLAHGTPSGKQHVFKVAARAADDLTRDTGDAAVVGEDEPDAGDAHPGENYTLERPAHFPEPLIPEINPLSEAKIELGRHLFYDKRLSLNQTQSCASCHQQALAFTDGLAVGVGSTGQKHTRGAMSLANVVYATTFTWANPLISDLEIQSTIPLFGEKPVELGLAGQEEELATRLREDSSYQELFAAAFPDESDPFNKLFVARAIASFERTLISGNSPYDRYLLGEEDALSESAKRGRALFFDESNDPNRSFECFHCHGGPTFSDQLTHAKQSSGDAPFHNTGLYNVDPLGNYPPENLGLVEFTMKPPDRGRFKAPTLRNIAVTAPYMHDGSVATLEEVIEHYARGGRKIESGPNAGDGKDNPYKSAFIHGFASATAEERADLLEFLKSLTDDEFLTNPKYGDPWPGSD